MHTAQFLSPSTEDYLETIFTIVSRNKVARSKDIAGKMKVKLPSVTGALKALAEKKLVNYQPHSYITLTAEGEKIARCVDRKHHVLTDLFTEVFMLPKEDAEKTACRMEHGMTTGVCEALNCLLMAVRNDETLARKLREGIAAEQSNCYCSEFCKDATAQKE